MTERQLIERCVKRDRQAQQELYEKYSHKMLSLCMRYVSDIEVAQDVLHDGFIVAFTKIGDFGHRGSFEGWLRRLFVNTALEYLRSKGVLAVKVQAETVYDLSSKGASAIENMEANELLEIIGSLPAGYKTVLNLYAIEGYSHKEIAEMLNISEGTSRSQYMRAKVLLQKMISQER